jgi:hypothetical protein
MGLYAPRVRSALCRSTLDEDGMKELPGALLGIMVGLVTWLVAGSVLAGVVTGIAAGIGWDLWRDRQQK